MSIETHIRAEKRYQNFTAAAFHPRGTLDVIWREWSQLREDASGQIPAKKALSMRQFKSALPDMLIAERTRKDEILIRLSGTRLDEMCGYVVSGKNLLDVVHHNLQRRINKIYTYVSKYPCGFYISEDIDLTSGQVMELDILVLPLTDANGKNTFFLSGYHFSNRHLFNPFEDYAVQMKPRKINQAGFIDLGYRVPYRK